MHTKVFGELRVHYNPDFSGKAIIQSDIDGSKIVIRGQDLFELLRGWSMAKRSVSQLT